MRRMRAVSPDEFMVFLGSHPGLEQRRVGGTVCYLEPGEWPENLVASFQPAGEARRRDGGWRVVIADEPEPESVNDEQQN